MLPGQYFDQETNIHYNYHRYYAPNISRYFRMDPFGYKAGINLFVYANNNSIVNFDSNGLQGKVSQGCGPGKYGDWIVPDNPAGYPFLPACNDHDKCYAGEFGCVTKKYCDKKFLKDMEKICEGLNIPEAPERPNSRDPGYPGEEGHSKVECRQTAKLYYFAVSRGGKKSFCGKERELKCGKNQYCNKPKNIVCGPEIGR